ncbi:MAG: hypothetical protein NTU66_07505 [Elusimicrobia bacterium]|nr:hypothetical protein [Elusimicrobiota bacterium]
MTNSLIPMHLSIAALENDGINIIDEQIEKIQAQTNFKEDIYAKYFLADLFILKGQFQEALKLYSSTLNFKSIQTHVTNTILNLKYQLKEQIKPIDIISTEKKFTKFGIDNIEKILPYLELLIQEMQDISRRDLLQYFGGKYIQERHYPISLFNGYLFGYDAQLWFYRQPYAFLDYCFYSIDEFHNLCLFLCRRSENMFRSSIDKKLLHDIPITENTLDYIHNMILQYKKHKSASSMFKLPVS